MVVSVACFIADFRKSKLLSIFPSQITEGGDGDGEVLATTSMASERGMGLMDRREG